MFFFIHFLKTLVIFVGPLIHTSVFGLLVTPSMGFKARVAPLNPDSMKSNAGNPNKVSVALRMDFCPQIPFLIKYTLKSGRSIPFIDLTMFRSWVFKQPLFGGIQAKTLIRAGDTHLSSALESERTDVQLGILLLTHLFLINTRYRDLLF